MRALASLSLASVVLLAACTTGGSSPSPSPSGSPAPSGAEFSIDVSPPQDPPEVRMAIPGERVVFLVTVSDAAGGPVTISATATKATIRSISPVELEPGVVGEVWVVPDAASTETTASVVISATKDGVTKTVERTVPIFPMVDERAADAKPYFDRWVAWLAEAQPELGIDATTAWEPAFVSTLLVVSHYAYWSDEWEMTVAWHNMIAPYDWSEVHLRERGVDVAPSIAFKIDSVSGDTEPYEITPPEVVVR